MTTIILSSLLILASGLCILLFSRNRFLSKKINKFITEKPIRTGYIEYELSITSSIGAPDYPFKSYVYINELDRYTNGESKIEIQKIEPGVEESKMSREKVEKYIKDRFKSIVKTSDVTWLESEQSIKDIRRNKLEQLKELTKK